jgi:FkbM family methyltransferase
MLSKIIYSLSSIYTKNFPVGRGKTNLINFILNSGLAPVRSITKSWDGRRFYFDSQNKYAFQIYFHGGREKNETKLMEQIIGPGDIAVDIGANIGWYTTLFSKLVGDKGKVIAIEAMPETFKMLEKNLVLNDCNSNVHLLNAICSDTIGDGVIFNFPDLHPGLASAKPYANESSNKVSVRKDSIDNIINKLKLPFINMLKIDVEGAEFEVIKGATSAFRNGIIQAVMIEANNERSQAFGYEFSECLDYAFECFPSFQIFRIIKKDLSLLPMSSTKDYLDGDNLLLVDRNSEQWKRLLSAGLL